MKHTKFVPTYPSIATHKGTPIRYYITMSDSAKILIEPLKTRAAGLVLRPASARRYIDLPESIAGGFALLGTQGEVINSSEIQDGIFVSRIEATVIYPDGRTWEGAIIEGGEKDVALLVWDWDLGRKINHANVEELFMFGGTWYEVPTTVAFFDESEEVSCGWSHRCPKQCDAISKFL